MPNPLLPSNPPEPPGLLLPARSRQPFPRAHGGAWKVAYADFVTAMMALFIVLWMMNSTQRVKASIAEYFRDPHGYNQRPAAGSAGLGNVADLQKQIEEQLRRMPEFARIKDHVQLSMTLEGLRIDLLENEQGLFFVTGSPHPTTEGEHLLHLLAAQIGKMPNRLAIEGHTDSRPYRNTVPPLAYSNWELSTDRANAARRLLLEDGLRADQVVEVRGYADQKLLDSENPESARNRRISLVVKFQEGQEIKA